MLDTLKYIFSIIKEQIEKTCKAWIDYMLYSEPYDFSKVVPGTGGERIRVIGPVVTRY